LQKMERTITEDLSIMWSGRDGRDIKGVLKAFERIEENGTPENLLEIIEFANRPDVGFWVRELLMQPIISMGGSAYLAVAFETLQKNEAEEYDSDSLVGYLIDFADSNRRETKLALEKILSDQTSPYHKESEWLAEFCE